MSMNQLLFYVLFAVLLFVCARELADMHNECESRGGELVLNYADVYVCVEVKK